MKKFIQKQSLTFSSLVVIGILSGAESASAQEAPAGAAGEGTFSGIAANAMATTGDLPGVVTGVSYMLGILLSVLGALSP